tara:strand:- start:10 stop:1002 length:993 start_codon:yes stop_codon:yes gene_type:complete
MKNFSKVLLMTLFGSLIYSSSAKADWDYYAIENVEGSAGFKVYTCEAGNCTLKGTQSINGQGWKAAGSYVNDKNELIIQGEPQNYVGSIYYKYDPKTNTISAIDDWRDNYTHSIPTNLVTQESNGTISIGENSLKLNETSTTQQLWGTNAEGKIVPIDITNGSKLLINGRDVEQSINNVGALSAALTGLPTVPSDTTLACGLGTGTHGGDFAFSGGCASKVNAKLSINYAASMTMPGQDYAGDFEDKFSARAGFVWKLGKSLKPTKISFKDKKIIDQKISDLEKNNKNLKAKNDAIISQNQKLLARLEKLENIALKIQKSSDMISIATKD